MIAASSPRTPAAATTTATSSPPTSTVHRIIQTSRQRARVVPSTTETIDNKTITQINAPIADTTNSAQQKAISSPIAATTNAAVTAAANTTVDTNKTTSSSLPPPSLTSSLPSSSPSPSPTSARVDDILSFIAAADKRTAEQHAIIARTTSQTQPNAVSQLHTLSTELTTTSSSSPLSSATSSEQTPNNNNSFKTIRDKLITLSTTVITHEKTIKLQGEEIKNKEEYYNNLIKNKQNNFELYITKQLTFIDSLLSDKNNLTNQIENLSQTISNNNKTYENNIINLKNEYENEKKNALNALENRESIKRSEWQRLERKRLKESTLRQLESDMMTLVTSHKERERKIAEALEVRNRDNLEEKEQEFLKRLETVRKNNRLEFDLELSHKEKQYQTQIELIRLETITSVTNSSKIIENELNNKINLLNQQINNLSQTNNNTLEQVKNESKCLLEQAINETKRLEKEKYDSLLLSKTSEFNDKLNNNELLRQEQTEKEINLIVNKLINENNDNLKNIINNYENKIKNINYELENKINNEKNLHLQTKQNLQNIHKNHDIINLDLNKLQQKYQNLSLSLSEKEKINNNLINEINLLKTELMELKQTKDLSEQELNNQWKKKCNILEYNLKQNIQNNELNLSNINLENQRQLDLSRDEWRTQITSLVAKKDALIDSLTAQLKAQQSALDNIADMNDTTTTTTTS